jgi:hypothetical protein
MIKIMKKSDLHREYARVIDMCELTSVNPLSCIKLGGIVCALPEIYFTDKNIDTYTFAIAIVEDRPVFVGDELYWKSGNNSKYKIKAIKDDGWLVTDDNGIFHIMGASWNPPKPKTFNLNGVELPLPVKEYKRDTVYKAFQIGGDTFLFEHIEQLNLVHNELVKLLSGK